MTSRGRTAPLVACLLAAALLLQGCAGLFKPLPPGYELRIYNRTAEEVKLILSPYGADPTTSPLYRELLFEPRGYKKIRVPKADYRLSTEIDRWDRETPEVLRSSVTIESDGVLEIENDGLIFEPTRDQLIDPDPD